MPQCCVPLCSNRETSSSDGNKISFHKFPKCKIRKQEWLAKIRRDEGPLFRVTYGTVVCSDHFEEECFYRKPYYQISRVLLPTAVPTKFAWTAIKKECQSLFQNNTRISTVQPSCMDHDRIATTCSESDAGLSGSEKHAEMPSCVATGCINGQEGDVSGANVTFHRFPFDNPSLLAQWVNAVRRDDWSPTKQSCLCSDHFTPKDFQRFDSSSLKVNAVPSKFKRLMSTRLKKAEKSDNYETSDKMKLKSNAGQRSENVLAKDNLESRKRERNDRRSLLTKRKLESSVDELNSAVPTKQTKGIQGKKLQKSDIVDESQSTTKFSVAKTVDESMSISGTASPKLDSKPSVRKSKGQTKSITNSAPKKPRPRKILKPLSDDSDDEFQVRLSQWEQRIMDTEAQIDKGKSSVIKSKSQTKSTTNSAPKKPRPRKIFKPLSDDSDDEFQVRLSQWEQRIMDAEAQIDTNVQDDKGEVLAAVRVELDESELSDNDEQPEAVFEKWMRKKMEREIGRNPSVTYTDMPNVENCGIVKQDSSCPGLNDMDHIVAVNERRTRYRYIYRVGQCFPEDDDDLPFIKSKLAFVIKALKSQSDKLQALQKRCRELSRSNATLKDILGIPSSNTDDEMVETDSQPAYLIIGSHPSGSSSLPSYRFTLTDCSPATISQSVVQ